MSKVYSPIVIEMFGKPFRLVRETFPSGETLEYPELYKYEITVEELRAARPEHPLLRKEN